MSMSGCCQKLLDGLAHGKKPVLGTGRNFLGRGGKRVPTYLHNSSDGKKLLKPKLNLLFLLQKIVIH